MGFLLLTIGACGGDDGPVADDLPTTESTEAETEAGLPPCAENRHMVAVDIIGFLTVENIEVVGPWIDGIPPTPRPGSVELLGAYRQRGYELLYLTTLPPNVFPDRSVEEAATEWLQASGYPTGEGTQLWVWDGTQPPDQQTWIAITDELLRLAAEGVSVDAGFTENTDKAFAFATGGVPEAQNYTLTPLGGLGPATPTSAPTTLIPNDDLAALAAGVQQQPPVCQVG